jgi:FlaA1/EpsC-like NDP-sugar epimerase
MKDIIIYGSGGMAREVVQLIEDINKEKPVWNILGYLDDYKVGAGETINGYKVLGGREKLCEMGSGANVVLAISDPKYKEKIYNSIKDLKLNFPVRYTRRLKLQTAAALVKGALLE